MVISPRSYFVFTPFLNDTAVGTLEFRTALEPVRRKNSGVSFVQGWADDVDFADKTVTVEPSVLDPDVGHALTGERTGNKSIQPEGHAAPTFKVSYDKLIIAVGCYSQTFGTKGVREHAMFLKDVGDARKIRRRILELFEMAVLPTTSDKIRDALLHFAIVGGGPTGMEFAAQLCDLVHQDLRKLYPALTEHVQISLYDVAPKVLPLFDASLTDYAVRHYKRQGIEIKTSHHVKELRQAPIPSNANESPPKGGIYTLHTKEEGPINIGMCVWTTGNAPNPFIAKALHPPLPSYPINSATLTTPPLSPHHPPSGQWHISHDAKTGALLVDPSLRLKLHTQPHSLNDQQAATAATATAIMTDVWCLGDAAHVASAPLPATAQVANQQAVWLAKHLNTNDTRVFEFRNLGIMAYLGDDKALLQGGDGFTDGEGHTRGIKGWLAFVLWRAAYLTMTLSWRNRILVLAYWLLNRGFGRDVTRF